jgi:DNA-binding SARP family transcriptional activator
LLALVATSPDASISRDRLLGLLWPDRDERTARHLLADSLYVLRQALGDDAIVVAGDSVSARLTIDVVDFKRAIAAERWSDALDSYRGDFLDGFIVRDAADFDQWVLSERDKLRTMATRAASTLARSFEQAERIHDAIVAAERAHALAPLDETVFRDLIRLLSATGNGARAQAMAREFSQRLERELGVVPSAETTRLMRGTRRRAVDATTRGIIAQGRHHWHRRTPRSLERSITYFSRAVERDPRAAEAWSGLADAWAVMAGRGYAPSTVVDKSAEFANRALAIDDTLAAAHTSLGGVNLLRRRWDAAMTSLRDAIELDPQNADAHHWLALVLMTGFGERDAAIRAQTAAATLNPVSAVQISALGLLHYLQGEYDVARSVLEPAVDLSVEIEEAPAGLVRAAARLGDENTVMKTVAAGLTRRADARGDLLAEQASALALLGDAVRARHLALEAQASGAAPINAALAWASLDDANRALEALSRETFRVYSTPHAVWWDPRFDALRGDPRFKQLLTRVERVWQPAT